MIDFSTSSLIAGFIFGVIGFWMLREGKKKANITIVVIGILLMAYPYFTKGPFLDWGVGVVLCATAYYFWEA
jgi:multisubunit Na+/H+ antiporter MnhE subunit